MESRVLGTVYKQALSYHHYICPPEELDALQLAVSILSGVTGREMAGAARSLSAKILSSLPDECQYS